MNKITSKIFLILVLISAFPFVSNAGMGMGPPAPCGGPFPPCPVPLDGSIWLLIAVAVIFGGKKIYDSIKKNPA